MLGPDWDKQAEGQKLKEEGEAFKKKLNTQDLFEDWKLKVYNIADVKMNGGVYSFINCGDEVILL